MAIQERIQTVRHQARRYFSTAWWIAVEVVKSYRKRVIVSMGLGLLGRSLQGAGILVILFFLRRRENLTDFTILGHHLPMTEIDLFWSCLIAAGLLLSLGSLIMFLSDRMTIAIAVDYTEARSDDLLSLSPVFPDAGTLSPDGQTSTALRSISNSIIIIIRVTRMIMQLYDPFIRAIVLAGVLAWLSLTVFGMVLLAVALGGTAYYLINLGVARNQRMMREAMRKRRDAVGGIIERTHRAPLEEGDVRGWTQEALAQPEATEAVERFRYRILAFSKTALVSGIVTAIALIMIFGYLGTMALSGEIDVATLFGCLIVARLMLAALQGIFSTFTGYARLFPMTRPLHEYIAAASEPRRLRRDVLPVRAPHDGGDEIVVEIRTGEPVAVICRAVPGRYTLHAFSRIFDARGVGMSRIRLLGSTWFVAHLPALAAPVRVGDLIGLAEAEAVAALRRKLAAAGLDPLRDLPDDPQATVSPEQWAALSPKARVGLSLAVALVNPARILVIDAGDYALLTEAEQSAWRDLLRDRFLLFGYQPSGPAFRYGERVGIVSDGEEAVAIVTPAWLREHSAAIARQLKKATRKEEELEEADDEG